MASTTNEFQGNELGPRLLIDPSLSPPPFDLAELQDQVDRDAEKDGEEMEEILQDVATISQQISVWTYARATHIDSTNLARIVESGQSIAKDEEAQDASRGVVSNFLQSFKSAFQSLAPQ